MKLGFSVVFCMLVERVNSILKYATILLLQMFDNVCSLVARDHIVQHETVLKYS